MQPAVVYRIQLGKPYETIEMIIDTLKVQKEEGYKQKAYLVKYKNEIEGFTYRSVSLVNYAGKLDVIRVDNTKPNYRELNTRLRSLIVLLYQKIGW